MSDVERLFVNMGLLEDALTHLKELEVQHPIVMLAVMQARVSLSGLIQELKPYIKE